MPAQECFLQNVFRVLDRSDHSIREREETLPFGRKQIKRPR
jgi:hypothetical protein